MSEISPRTRQALRRIVLERQGRHRVPGVFAGVVRGGGLLWGEGVGAADVTVPDEPPTADTQFLVASNSKTFTAVAVMALRDEGRLDLDDMLEKFIPRAATGGSPSGRCSRTSPACSANPSATCGRPSSSPRGRSWSPGSTTPRRCSGRTTAGTTRT